MSAHNHLAKVGRACGSVTPAGFEGIATVSTLSARTPIDPQPGRVNIFRTANSAAAEAETPPGMLKSAMISANAITGCDTPSDGWYPIAPFGTYPAPDGSYLQKFGRAQAEEIVKTWNSIGGKAYRWLKNVRHRIEPKFSTPVFELHSDTDPFDYSAKNPLAELEQLRVGNSDLEGLVKWNTANMARRGPGPLFPSALWWHEAPDATGTVYPAHMESVGLTPRPNIPTRAWTANASGQACCGKCGAHFDSATVPEVSMGAVACPSCGTHTDQHGNPFAGTPQAENKTQNDTMNPEEIIALRKALGLPETADFAACLTSANAAHAALATLTERDTALTTANSARTALETQLSTANGQVTSITAERDQLTTANGALTAHSLVLVTGALNLAEKKGAITPAERPAFQERLTTANTAEAAFTELKDRKAMNTQPVEINGSRVDLSTANSRADVLTSAVQKRMTDDKCDYAAAHAAVKKDPAFAALFAAMADPTRKNS